MLFLSVVATAMLGFAEASSRHDDEALRCVAAAPTDAAAGNKLCRDKSDDLLEMIVMLKL